MLHACVGNICLAFAFYLHMLIEILKLCLAGIGFGESFIKKKKKQILLVKDEKYRLVTRIWHLTGIEFTGTVTYLWKQDDGTLK